jgi:hypothetical protein
VALAVKVVDAPVVEGLSLDARLSPGVARFTTNEITLLALP